MKNNEITSWSYNGVNITFSLGKFEVSHNGIKLIGLHGAQLRAFADLIEMSTFGYSLNRDCDEFHKKDSLPIGWKKSNKK